MIGTMRLVNPDRGLAVVAVAGEIVAVSEDGGGLWELRLLRATHEFYTRRPLASLEVRALADGRPGPEPWSWRWEALGESGPLRLRPEERPTREALTAACQEASRVDGMPAAALPRLDRFEVWLCDRQAGRPLALAATALSREMALALPHVRPWQCVVATEQTPETWAFQLRIHALVNHSRRAGRFRSLVRLYERTIRGVIRHGLDGPLGRVRAGYMPEGLLAEPWESERLALRGRRGSPAGAGPPPPGAREPGPRGAARVVTLGSITTSATTVGPRAEAAQAEGWPLTSAPDSWKTPIRRNLA